MNKYLYVLVLASIGLIKCQAAATVALNNKDANVRIILSTEPWAVGNIYVKVFAGVDGQANIPVEQVGTGQTVFQVDKNGYFDGGIGIIPGVINGGGTITLLLKAWYAPNPDVKDSNVRGATLSWMQQCGNWNPASGLPATGPVFRLSASPTFQAYSVPEMKSYTQGLFGGTALLTTNVIMKTSKPKTNVFKYSNP